jgi:hypothetical protein
MFREGIWYLLHVTFWKFLRIFPIFRKEERLLMKILAFYMDLVVMAGWVDFGLG